LADDILIDKLEFLLALSRERHFGRAAEACGVTQPTLSAGLKHLEESLGLLLVTRGSRFQGLTSEGERVLDWAKRIVGDVRTMRQEVRALKQGQLVGQLRIAAIPTALAMVSALTTPYHEQHPDMRFSIRSCTSSDVLAALDDLEVDAGISYLDNEPIGRRRAIPLYREQYRLLIAADRPLGDRKQVTWAEIGQVPLCLLTPDMQNRRIINQLLREAGILDPAPTLESNSMILLFSHVRTGRWASVMPAILAETLGLSGAVRAIPIVDPAAVHTIGLIVADREPMAPATAALVAQALRVAPTLDQELFASQ
jgi:DNA-binding transcriptional LysR family regulator